MTATTLDDESFLRLHYPDIDHTIDGLRAYGARVNHGVDATVLDGNADMLRSAPLPHKIVFNFPHPGWPKGPSFLVEECAVMIERHVVLLRDFFLSSRHIAQRTGCPALEVHVTHTVSKKGVDRWNVVAVGEEYGLEHVGTHPFDAQPFRAHGYQHKYGTLKAGNPKWKVNGSFPFNFAVTDVFRATGSARRF